MPEVRAELYIPRPPAEVYAAAKDLEGLKPYLKEVESLKVLERREGYSRSDWIAVAMGKKVHWVEEETWDDRSLRNRFWSPEGDFDRYEGTWTFLPRDGGTQVELVVTYELNLPIFGGLLQRLIQKLMKENCEALLRGLKERVEASSAAS
jgi:uncharacterized membrane protein